MVQSKESQVFYLIYVYIINIIIYRGELTNLSLIQEVLAIEHQLLNSIFQKLIL